MNTKIEIKVYQVGLHRIRATYVLTVDGTTILKDLYGMIASTDNELPPRAAHRIAATIRAYDPSYIGRYRYPGRVFTSDNPEEVPKFQLDKSDSTRTILDCGISSGCELMFDNGEMD
jgi:hypothetical protein